MDLQCCLNSLFQLNIIFIIKLNTYYQCMKTGAVCKASKEVNKIIQQDVCTIISLSLKDASPNIQQNSNFELTPQAWSRCDFYGLWYPHFDKPLYITSSFQYIHSSRYRRASSYNSVGYNSEQYNNRCQRYTKGRVPLASG